MRIDRTLLREQDARLKSAWHEIEEASQRILRQLAEAESVSPEEARLVLDASYALWRVDQGVHELIDLHRALVERLNKASPALLPRGGGTVGGYALGGG
ncbi:hypothetical protein KDK95_03270 [Actinospica sp. MGRD01-02]|uniref:Uncharacterized protein n=1 Tax=Actinospica acidithermotolerans TaxID=2828514 RepID=A0A941IFQ8_9ACTN|nr:hypothetical protein [Actinospica acidithermotolerans]MBR7825314.1 hypothetical protein [Actinospica acidithermotolerans]